MGYAIIFQYSIGLPGTDDPVIGEKVAIFKMSKSRFPPKKKNVFQLIENNCKMIISTPLVEYVIVE